MTRETLERKIDELQNMVLELGSLVEQATVNAVDSLKNRDIEAAKVVYRGDKQINDLRFEIENQCMVVMASQQPMATDLRILASMLEIATELERMGDYAKGIALINIRMGDEPLLKPLDDLPKMAELTTNMLQRALKAFVAADETTAREIHTEDDIIDDLYNGIYRELMKFMISDPSMIDRANYLLWAAHNLERMADRVTNICERTIFVATGKLIELDSSDDELELGEV